MERAKLGAAIVAVVLCAACSRAPDRDLFAEGEQDYLNGKYSEAVAIFRQRLLQDPDDAGAHFYLGTCLLNRCMRPGAQNSGDRNTDGPFAWLGIAEGELETALSLFDRQGKVNPVPHFSSAEYFEMICHVNHAKIYLLLIQELLGNARQFHGVDVGATLPGLLKKCKEQADAAERISPNHPDVQNLKQLIAPLLNAPRRAPLPPSPDTAA